MKNKELEKHWTSESIDPARWCLGDIHGKALDMGIPENEITKGFCEEIAAHLKRCFDAEIGINWLVIEFAIQYYLKERN